MHHQPFRMVPSAGTIQRVLSVLAGEELSISDVPSNKVCVVARKDTWSRSARRKVRVPNPDPPARGTKLESGEDGGKRRPLLLVAHVWVEKCAGESKAQVIVQWRQGRDAQAFESFASHVARKMREAAEAEAEVIFHSGSHRSSIGSSLDAA